MRTSVTVLVIATASNLAFAQAMRVACLEQAQEHSLPLPSSIPAEQYINYRQSILQFLQANIYVSLKWCADKGIRDTGPYRNSQSYGTHPAVKIFYSPKIMEWLVQGRRGEIPDGAMIIKGQYPPPAARYAGTNPPSLSDWTVMIRDSKGSKDGWFWGEFFDNMTFNDTDYPWAGFGLYCIRCHAAAKSNYTFASLNNIEGFPGMPIQFPDDGSWRNMPRLISLHSPGLRTEFVASPKFGRSDFLNIFSSIPFSSIPKISRESVLPLPQESHDNVVAPATGPGRFLTSNQCQPCHSALNGPFGPVMFLPAPSAAPGKIDGANVSPYGEWRWSPMGLAGRDPIFYAQLESEIAIAGGLSSPDGQKLSDQLRNLCLSCHGVMGHRQLNADAGGNGDFLLEYLQVKNTDDPNFIYGALARDGISCTTCHRALKEQAGPGERSLEAFLRDGINGTFQVSPPSELNGPYRNSTIQPYVMRNALGIKPRYYNYISSSRLCGSCHTIDLPVTDGRMAVHSIEQSTYLEWLNSAYQNEFGDPGPRSQTCQDCHMPKSYKDDQKAINVERIHEKIAIISDETYPDAEERVPMSRITIPKRSDFSRHTFLGLNVFLIGMFQQFPDILGVRLSDYMSGSSSGSQGAINYVAEQARMQTAQLTVMPKVSGPGQISAEVTVSNLAGHRFPSGVGFRRAFLETVVIQTNPDGTSSIVWGSGRTNGLGVIVDGKGQILPSEFFTPYQDQNNMTQQYFQDHHIAITSEDQVQIYEELVQDANGKFTTSFVRRDATIKDNRLLPAGWSKEGPSPSLTGRYLLATHPDGRAESDPDYQDGRGSDTLRYNITLPADVDPARCIVRTTLYYQSIPPYYLADRFNTVPTGDSTRRLQYLASNLDVNGTPMESWKLRIASISAPVLAQ